MQPFIACNIYRRVLLNSVCVCVCVCLCLCLCASACACACARARARVFVCMCVCVFACVCVCVFMCACEFLCAQSLCGFVWNYQETAVLPIEYQNMNATEFGLKLYAELHRIAC